MCCFAYRVECLVTEEKVADVLEILETPLSKNLATINVLKQFLGKAENVATVILVWRPFLREL